MPDPYRVETALHEGAHATIAVGAHATLGTRVALKILRTTADATRRARFEREAVVMAA